MKRTRSILFLVSLRVTSYGEGNWSPAKEGKKNEEEGKKGERIEHEQVGAGGKKKDFN